MDSDKSDIDEEVELDMLNDEEFGKKLTEMVEREDGKDLDWIPERLKRKTQKAASKRKNTTDSESDFNHAVHDNTTNENTNPLAEDISDEDNAEEWEQELDSTLASNTEIHDWKTLCDQIQNDL
ncbi:hypothetical protein BDR06DRAFT_975890 [Suillus hirtellus]|nr:hypothetical protein BDR06DRAFT_975890 [Suillus hirtellus]